MKPTDARGDRGPDYGTPQMQRKHPAIAVPTEAAGIMAAQVVEECFLDSLYQKGRLRHPEESAPPHDEEARRRLQAGLWLREVFHKAAVSRRTTMAYTVFGQAGGEHPHLCACKQCDSEN